MSIDHHISPSQAAQITERIGHTFDFVRDVLETPEILDEIPDGAVLYTRAVDWRGECLHLVAHRVEGKAGDWVARVTAPAHIARTSQRWMAPIESRGTASRWGSPPTFPEQGPTAEAALDALEEKLHDAEVGEPESRWAANG
jgi:hypothetical protein